MAEENVPIAATNTGNGSAANAEQPQTTNFTASNKKHLRGDRKLQ